MMENNYFFKKLTSKHTEEKERCACNYTIARNEEFNLHNKNYAQNVTTRESNNIFNMKKVDLDES